MDRPAPEALPSFRRQAAGALWQSGSLVVTLVQRVSQRVDPSCDAEGLNVKGVRQTVGLPSLASLFGWDVWFHPSGAW